MGISNTDGIKAALLRGLRCQRLSDVGLFIHRDLDPDPQCHKHYANVTIPFMDKVKQLVASGDLTPHYKFMAEDLFIRQRIEGVQAMFSQWMSRAFAQVEGENIPFKNIIIWCQNCPDWAKRRTLQREARALCRFLAPFSHATWQALLSVVVDELGYQNYLDFCQNRRVILLNEEYETIKSQLASDRKGYRARVEKWLRSIHPQVGLHEATRFDAIYLLGMRYLDPLAGGSLNVRGAFDFFSTLGLTDEAGIRVHVDGSPGRQTYCVPVEVPGEIHLVVGPITGWIDWEAFFHEMGHAFSFANVLPALSQEERQYWTSGAVSETFAFLFQRLSMKKEFLKHIHGNGDGNGNLEFLENTHALKFEVLTRRYGAKFIIEFENFSKGRISKGQDLYARVMERETGFLYDPETYLFDLMPDFYSLDYYQAFKASEQLMQLLEARFGPFWFKDNEAIGCLRQWASLGNSLEIHEFMAKAVT